MAMEGHSRLLSPVVALLADAAEAGLQVEVGWHRHTVYNASMMFMVLCCRHIIIPCKPYLSASAPRLTLWGGGK
jgi:hypothetical protein